MLQRKYKGDPVKNKVECYKESTKLIQLRKKYNVYTESRKLIQ